MRSQVRRERGSCSYSWLLLCSCTTALLALLPSCCGTEDAFLGRR